MTGVPTRCTQVRERVFWQWNDARADWVIVSVPDVKTGVPRLSCCYADDESMLVSDAFLWAYSLRGLMRSADVVSRFILQIPRHLAILTIARWHHQGQQEHKDSNPILRALRALRGVSTLTEETSDRRSFLAASMARRLYSKLSCRVLKNIGKSGKGGHC